MDKRTSAILIVILSSLVCGLPGIASFCLGSMAILGTLIPESDLSQSDARIAQVSGIIMVFLGLVLVVIPIISWLLTKRFKDKKPILSKGEIPQEDF